MASPLDSTMGVWLVSLFLGTILYGMGLIQTYLYFHWYTKDHWGVKAVNLRNTANHFFFCATYWLLIDHFGDFDALVVVTWHESVQLLAGVWAQPCILPIAFTLTALALLQIAQTVVSTKLGSFTLLYQTKGIATLQLPVPSTNSLLNMLMINAVNRGMLTAFTAALHIILFLVSLALVPSGKLYMNSMLATLNTREHIRQCIQQNSVGRISISLGNLSSNPSSGPTNPQTPADTTTDISSLNGHNSHNQGKKHPFTANMV
ncbi:hypothetical protein B0H14DRAFT_2576771 [Mycena olivaceomarginata]|nr:hypothetical protein B0H14DRAFT_2576771 [Mycena olivaceomarginata]